MSTYLVTLADIQERYPVSMQMQDADLNPHVLAAQKFGLRSVLGEAMYLDVLAQVGGGSPDPATIAVLEYIKDYLCYEISYRLFDLHQYKITGAGVVRKTSALSEPISDGAMNKASGILKSYSKVAADALVRFICENQADYPLFGGYGQTGAKVVPSFGSTPNNNPNN